MEQNLFKEESEKKVTGKDVNKHLSSVFVIVGIISFTLGAIVNYYTIKRLKG